MWVSWVSSFWLFPLLLHPHHLLNANAVIFEWQINMKMDGQLKMMIIWWVVLLFFLGEIKPWNCGNKYLILFRRRRRRRISSGGPCLWKENKSVGGGRIGRHRQVAVEIIMLVASIIEKFIAAWLFCLLSLASSSGGCLVSEQVELQSFPKACCFCFALRVPFVHSSPGWGLLLWW